MRNTDCSKFRFIAASAVNVSEKCSRPLRSPAKRPRRLTFAVANPARALNDVAEKSPSQVPESESRSIDLAPPLPGHSEHRRTRRVSIGETASLGKQSRKYRACREDSSRREDRQLAMQTTGWQTVGVPRRQAKANQTKAKREREREREIRLARISQAHPQLAKRQTYLIQLPARAGGRKGAGSAHVAGG